MQSLQIAIDFLKEYTTGTLNPDPLYAVCAISARLSEHPAVLKSPPSSNGQVYVRHIRSRIPYLISQVNLEMVHTITLIAKSEYAAGNLAQEYRLDGIAQQMVIEYKSGQGESRSGSGGGTERGGSTQDEYSEDTKDQQEDGLQVVQMYLTKSVLAADEIIAIVDQFTDEEIKICGPPYSFPMFIAGTVYVMQQFMDKTSNLTGEVEKKLMTCQRFLRALGPYWKGASDQALLLKRLSLSGGSGSGGGGGDGGSESRAAHGTSLSSSALPMGSLMEFMVSSPSMFAYETEDFTIGHISLTGEEQEASSTAHLKSDLQADISLERLLDTSGKQKEGKPEAKGAMNVFMTTDTGVGTLWRRPEKMAELKEATLLSLEKLSMFESHLSKDSS
ncbi:hypothetical protein EC991_007330 [Linnemannia zychae]|nr:hypothetical protein EC991_007330 [Linnemannia zychae]